MRGGDGAATAARASALFDSLLRQPEFIPHWSDWAPLVYRPVRAFPLGHAAG